MLEKKRVLQLLFLNLNRVQIGLLLLVSFYCLCIFGFLSYRYFVSCFGYYKEVGNLDFCLVRLRKTEHFYFFYGVIFLYCNVCFVFEPLNLQFSELERRWSMLIYPLIFLGTPQLMNNKK